MTTENKRKHPRIPSLNLSYICLDENNNIVKQGMGRTLNISESGILLETHFPIESEYLVLMTIALKEDLLEIKPFRTTAAMASKLAPVSSLDGCPTASSPATAAIPSLFQLAICRQLSTATASLTTTPIGCRFEAPCPLTFSSPMTTAWKDTSCTGTCMFSLERP